MTKISRLFVAGVLAAACSPGALWDEGEVGQPGQEPDDWNTGGDPSGGGGTPGAPLAEPDPLEHFIALPAELGDALKGLAAGLLVVDASQAAFPLCEQGHTLVTGGSDRGTGGGERQPAD